MTKGFELFVRLFSMAAQGIPINSELISQLLNKDGTVNINLMASVSLAASHQQATGMMDLSFQDLYVKLPGFEPQASVCLSKVKSQIMTAISVTDEIYTLMNTLEKNGITCCILKGISLSRLYAVPECRISCDTDVLISENDENRAYELMKDLGYNVVPRTEYSHHATCTHPYAGKVELHTDLFFEMINDVIFSENDLGEDISNERYEFEINGYTFKTLGITENLIYVTMHLIQHFVRSGTSVRQMCDLLMYCKRYKSELDMERYFSILDKLSYRGIYNVIMSCGVKYMNFSDDDLPEFELLSDEVCDGFMTDIENGGWVGSKRSESFTVFHTFGSLRAKGREKEYKQYLKKYQRERMISSVFPKRERLIAKFPFAKNPLLIVPAWFCWLLYGFKLLKTGELASDVKDRSDVSEDEKKRLELFGSLGIINTEDI